MCMFGMGCVVIKKIELKFYCKYVGVFVRDIGENVK